MMNREFIERNLSAYLDGQLLPKEMREFERELKQYPDLASELERLRRLDAIARGAQVDLPPDGYFDGLAERIDASIGRESSSRRFSTLWGAVAPKSRLIPILSSVAAVFLVVVVVNHLYQPELLRKSPTAPSRIIQVKPVEAERDRQLSIPAKASYQMSMPEKKDKSTIGDTVLGKVITSSVVEIPVKDEALDLEKKAAAKATAPASSRMSETQNALSAPKADLLQLQAPEAESAEQKGFSAPLPVDARDLRKPEPDLTPQARYSGGIHFRARQGVTPEEYEAKIRADQESHAAQTKAYQATEAAQGRTLLAPPDAKRKLKAKARGSETGLSYSDTLRTWSPGESGIVDLYTLATKESDVFNLILARLYVERYLSQPDAGNKELWQARLDSLRISENAKRKEWHDSVNATQK